MSQIRIVLLVSAAPAVTDVITRVAASQESNIIVLEARNGVEAIEIARTQPIALVVLDLDCAGVMRPQDICVKLRALRLTLPIVPLGANLDAAPLLADLGCAAVVPKSLLVANPLQLRDIIQDASQQAPVLAVPEGTFNYLLEQADAALKEARRQDQFQVAVRCRNVLLRCGFVHALTSLGVAVHLVAAGSEAAPLTFDAPSSVRLVIGPLDDRTALQSIAQEARLPLLLVALQQRELEVTAYAALMGASVLLFDEGGDTLQLLTAMQTIAAGAPFLAVPAGVIARWAAPPDGLTPREWEVIVALLLTANPEIVAQRSGLSRASVETYSKRVRNKLGSRSLSDTLAIVQAHVTAQLGVAPSATPRAAQAVQTAR